MKVRPSRLGALAVLGLAIVLWARWIIPLAPPLYDGIISTPPYQYCSPPDNLRSSNMPPTAGQGDLQATNGVNKLGTIETDDRQVVAFFAQGVFKLSPGSIRISISPLCDSAPLPPPHSTLVGNPYRIQATVAGTAASPPPLITPAQVLLRVPPIAYNAVRLFYDGSWHDVRFGAQTDLVNVSLDRLGVLAAVNDTSLGRKPVAPPSFNYAGLFEVGLIVIAVLLIGAGIVAQRRRTQVAKEK